MTFTSESIQLLVILIAPALAIGIFRRFSKRLVGSKLAGIVVVALTLSSGYLLTTQYSLGAVGIVRCPEGQRQVEGLHPSIFKRQGDIEECIPDTSMSEAGEWLNHLRPSLQLSSFAVTFCMCFATLWLAYRRRSHS